MACKASRIIMQSTLSIMDTESIERPCRAPTACCSVYNSCKQQSSSFCLTPGVSFNKSFLTRRNDWKITFALDTGGIPDGGDEQQDSPSDNDGLGQTRLGRIVSAGGKQLLEKLNSARKNFPMKVFLLLLGFYSANALATILGQTGDWDVLVAGIVVAAIEGIGVLVYKKPPAIFLSTRRLQSFLVMINYWKAGLCLGLFVDAFKLGS